jgi:hypothetical protein
VFVTAEVCLHTPASQYALQAKISVVAREKLMMLVLVLGLGLLVLVYRTIAMGTMMVLYSASALLEVCCVPAAITNTAATALFLQTLIPQALGASAVTPALCVHWMVTEYNLPVS